MTSPFALLPVELVRYIFELAGRADNSSASQLTLVSRPVRSWILPIFYQTLVIKNAHQCQRLYHTLSLSPSLAGCVKNISIRVHEGDNDPHRSTVLAFHPSSQHYSFQHALASVLQYCQNVSNVSTTLSLDRLFEAAASSYSVRSLRVPCHDHYTSRLTNLHCASWDSWFYFTRHLHSYQNLTHLRVDTVYNCGLSASWSFIVHYPTEILPNLTHLAFGFDSRSSFSEFKHLLNLVKSLLERQHLQSLVIMACYCWDSVKLTSAMSGVGDLSRVKILTSPSYWDEKACLEEWNAAARGESDLWDRAFKTGISLAA